MPRVNTRLSLLDICGTVLARLGATRNNYAITPGLYCLGQPHAKAPVIVTANYKLTFDALRKELSELDAWLLVLDTRGINVWCAAGKNLFSTKELIEKVAQTGLTELVDHRELILPQLGATGTSAGEVKKGCGFKVVYGPIKACDLKHFILSNNSGPASIRRVTFTLRERAVLIPVEMTLLWKFFAITTLIAFPLSGIGPGIFSVHEAWTRGILAVMATFLGILGGCILVPLFLPWLQGRYFSIKGAITGIILATGYFFFVPSPLSNTESVALFCWLTTCSSYLGMNFTGSTPFTSPSGVEKEMRTAIPLQLLLSALAVILWLTAPFLKAS